MADYYPLINKAVAGLDPNAPGESRRAVYQRARAALLAQLRTMNPPFTEAEVTRERLALEDAVGRVEEEASQRARGVHVPTLEDLMAAADDLGKPAAEAKRRHIGRMANPILLSEISVEMPSMIVTGGATGRLIGFWRWRSLPPRRVA
jgi:hypothetical protein